MAANMFVLEFMTWVLIPAWYLLPVIVLPVVIVNALVAYGMTKVRSATAQVGRGMLIACASAPLTAVVFFLAVFVANAVGPL
jgi:hypothetical protein